MSPMLSKYIALHETPSTNDYMEALLGRTTPAEGTIVYTHYQTAGKGQEHNKWESEAGSNILATTVLYPEFLLPEKQFYLTMVLSLSVCSLIRETEPMLRPMIKWPNDIYLNNRKIAGILIKNSLEGHRILHTIAGLGMNINQTGFSSNAPLAVSLTSITGKIYDIPTLLTKWHESLMWWYAQLRENKTTQIEEVYLSLLYKMGQAAEFLIKGRRITANITGLGEFGMLKLKGNDGTHYLCDLKEIVFIPSET